MDLLFKRGYLNKQFFATNIMVLCTKANNKNILNVEALLFILVSPPKRVSFIAS